MIRKKATVSPSSKITAKVCAKLFSVVLQSLQFLLIFFNFTAENIKLVTCKFLSNTMHFFYIKMMVSHHFSELLTVASDTPVVDYC